MEDWEAIDFKSARVRSRLSLKDAATAIGVSPRMLIYFEAGERNLSPDKKLELIKLIVQKQAELEQDKCHIHGKS